jgi:hypothetical protein
LILDTFETPARLGPFYVSSPPFVKNYLLMSDESNSRFGHDRAVPVAKVVWRISCYLLMRSYVAICLLLKFPTKQKEEWALRLRERLVMKVDGFSTCDLVFLNFCSISSTH